MNVPASGNPFEKVISARYVMAIISSVGMAIVYGLRVNLSVAMVGMLNHTEIKRMANYEQMTLVAFSNDLECEGDASSNYTDPDGPFAWPSNVQGIVLSCYFWGYIFSQIPGGRIAEVFSAKWVIFFSIAINAICALLTPILAYIHYAGVVLMRVGQGVGGGLAFPAMHVVLSKWAPPAERGTMACLVYAGTSLGTVVSLLMSGVLTVNWGWESVFYVMGGLTLIWCVLCIFFIQDSPQKQRLISPEERDMIVTSLGGKQDVHHKKQPFPWRSVMSSRAFLAILVAHTCSNWGWYMLLIETPFYMKQILKFNMKENAVLTSIPFLLMWFYGIALSRTLDWMRTKNYIKTSTARKLGTLSASAIPSLCLLGLCYVGCARAAAVVLMTISIMSNGGMYSGFLSNHIDIAPNFAGTLMAITNTFATIPGIAVPNFVSYITDGNQTISAWRVIFGITIALYCVEMIVYTIFGTAEVQPWNNVLEYNAARTRADDIPNKSAKNET